MMPCINKRFKYLSLIILPALVWLITNSTVNTHTHTLTGDIEISHAHPYNKNTGQTNSSAKHNHSKGEFFLLDLISHPLTLLVYILFVFILSGNLQTFIIDYIPQFRFREHYYVMNYHAPPAYL